MRLCKLVLLASLILVSGDAFAQICPPAPTSMDPTLRAAVSYDQKSGTYTYNYSMHNEADSLLPIDYFTLSISQQPSNVQSPNNWLSRYVNLLQTQANLRWATISAASDSSGVGGSDVSVPVSAVQPGQRLDGFGFQSSQRPGVLQYYAEGFTEIPTSTATAQDDEPEPNCPGWDFTSPRLQTLVTGMSVGPSAPNAVSVRIRLRTEDGLCYGALNPNNPTGNVAVLVLSTHHFDASTINVSSVKFGPGGAVPLSSQLVPATFGRGDGRDEREEWERIQQKLGPDDSEDSTRQNLLLVFNFASVGVQCILDKALFLTGTTQSGFNIIGGVSTSTVGCDIHNPGVRKH
jgi:hypothetical protein